MKKTNQKILFYLLMLLTIGIIAALGWFGFKAYNAYEKDRINVNRFSVMTETEQLIESVGAERLASAAFLASGEKWKQQELKKRRQKVDTGLLNLRHALQRYKLENDLSLLNNVANEVKAVRSRVDAMSQEYRDLFVGSFQKRIADPLLKIYTNTTGLFRRLGRVKELKFNEGLMRLYIDEDLERSYIAYLLSVEKTMNNEDLKIWDQVISQDALPAFVDIEDILLRSRLKDILVPERFSVMINPLRQSVLYGINNGKYPIKPKKWIDGNNDRIKKIVVAASMVNKQLRTQMLNKLEKEKRLMIQYGVAVLFFLILLIIFIVIFYNINKESKLLDETLKNIEFELDPHRKRQLQEIVQRRDLPAIYNFLAQTIREANETKDLFLANMSHEIRTPLNGIVGFTQLLKNTPMTPDQEEFISVIESSSENLLSIVNDILDLSKINADKVELEEITFNALDKFEDAVESYGAKAAQKDVEFSVFVDPSLPKTLIGDPTKISQVIVNLVSNAIKFTSSHGQVDVIIEKREETETDATVYFAVRDTGIGISEEQKEKIFEAFSQADAGTSRKYGGTGLGLAISSKLVERMGGHLDIDSTIGEGSTFFFELTLPKGEDQEKYIPDVSGLQTAIVLPKKDMVRQTDINLKRYVEYCSAEFEVLSYDDIFDRTDLEMPDILFVDHKYCRRARELDMFLELNTRIVLLTTGELKKEAEAVMDRLSKIIYKPVNFSKTVRALESIHEVVAEGIAGEQEEETFENLRILVAEDNPINQKLIRTTLEKFGAEVTLASNGKEAFHLRKQNDFDLIFMDIQMPVMDGIEATREILHYEQVNHLRHIPIVALTANALTGDREKYIEAGMDNYMPKPINIPELKALIATYHPHKRKTVVKPKQSGVSGSERQERKSERPARPRPRRRAEREKRRKILLYTPSSMLQKLYGKLLESAGLEVIAVPDEIALIEKLDKDQFSAAILDGRDLEKGECLLIETMKEADVEPIVLVNVDVDKFSECGIKAIRVSDFASEIERRFRGRES
ncbi:ATP-binding protein [Nitratifractor sp.]